MRAEALATANRDRRNEGNLPTFAEHEREHIPLNSMTDDYEDVDDKQQYHPRFASTTDVGAPSIISGVGEGYGRRNNAPPGLPVTFSATGTSLISPGGAGPNDAPHSPVLAVGGVGSRLGAEARANRGRATSTDQDRLYTQQRQGSQTTKPFQGMYDPSQQPQQQQDYYQQQQQGQGYHDPYQQSTSPPPQQQQYQQYSSMPEPTVVSPTYSNHLSPTRDGAYPPYPAPQTTIGSSYSQPTVIGAAGGYPSQSQQQSTPYGSFPASDSKQNFSYPTSSSPPPQQYQPYSQPHPQQSFHLANQTTGDGASIAPTYYTNEPQQGSYGGNGTYGQHQQPPVPSMPNPHSPTYGAGQGSSADAYGVPYGSSGAQRY
jgi:hypothetical protein